MLKTKYNTDKTGLENKIPNTSGLFKKINYNTKIAELSSLNRKITQNKSKHLLVENELNKLKTFDSSYFIGKSHFGEDGTKCSGNCNNINNPYAKICVPNVIKDLNVKVFNLMSRTNETRFMKQHEKCKYICRLDAIVFNNKQRWNRL